MRAADYNLIWSQIIVGLLCFKRIPDLRKKDDTMAEI